MSHLDWETFRSTDFDGLAEAAGLMQDHAEQQTDDIEQRVSGVDILQEDSDQFQGTVADESRHQATRLQNEHQNDMEYGWKRGANYLQDAHQGFVEQHRELLELFAEAGVELVPAGGIGEEHFEVRLSTASDFHDTGYTSPAEEQRRLEELIERAEHCSSKFKTIMATVREIDDAATAGLQAIDADSLGPQVPSIGDRDFEEKSAEYDAAKAAELWSGGEDGELSPEELDLLNDTLEYWGDDPKFTTGLMNEIGPDGLYDGLGTLQTIDGPFSDDAIRRTWENLGTALASATDPSNHPHVDEEWTEEFMALGTEVMYDPDAPQGMREIRGFQQVAPLFSHGDYHSDFLVPVADEMLMLDSQDLWYDVDDAHALSLAEHGDNPVNYALDALDRNPEAALDFFTGADRDLTVGSGRALDPFDYLMERAVQGGTAPDLALNPDLIGNTLESATTGLPSDTPIDGDLERPRHSSYQTGLVERIMDRVYEHPEHFRGKDAPLSGMADNFGDIAVNYIEDINAAFTDGEYDWQKHSPGVPLDLGHYQDDGQQTLKQFLQTIGQDPEAFGRVWQASEAYSAVELSNIFAGTPDNLDDAVYRSVSSHGLIMAEMTNGMFQAMNDGQFAAIDGDTIEAVKDENWNHMSAQDRTASVINYGAQTVAGFIPGSQYAGPLTGETITALTNTFRPDIDAYLGAEQDNFKETMSDRLQTATIEQIEALRQDPAYAEDPGVQTLTPATWADERTTSYQDNLNLQQDEYGRLAGLDENGDPVISDDYEDLAPRENNADSLLGGN